MCRCGTSGDGLVGMVVLGGWLNSMTLEVFSNLWFYENERPAPLQKTWTMFGNGMSVDVNFSVNRSSKR